jgi:hypothetical protein
VRAEHWDMLQGGWLLGDHQICITERGQRARRDVAGRLRVPPNLSSHRLGWQAEYAHECPPHSFAIRKAGLPRDGLDRMPTVFQHQPGGLETKFLDGLCRRLAGLGRKRSSKLAGAQMGRLRQLFHGKLGMEIFPRECESGLNSVGLRLDLEKGPRTATVRRPADDGSPFSSQPPERVPDRYPSRPLQVRDPSSRSYPPMSIPNRQ